jgi:large subunit ribosomal protein L15e
MGFYKYVKEMYQERSVEFKALQRERLIAWRRENVVTDLEVPTNLPRARELGYKAKKGIKIARIKVKRGGKRRPAPKGGRRSKNTTTKFVMGKSYQRIAEERMAKQYPNMEVLNSYKAGQDGKSYWFEVIIVDPCMPEIMNDKDLKWICSERGRVFRGKTSAGKKGRGMGKKGVGTEKARPSVRANKRRVK